MCGDRDLLAGNLFRGIEIVAPAIFSNGQWWDDGQANTPPPPNFRPGNEPWRDHVGPDIGLRTFGPAPGSAGSLREW